MLPSPHWGEGPGVREFIRGAALRDVRKKQQDGLRHQKKPLTLALSPGGSGNMPVPASSREVASWQDIASSIRRSEMGTIQTTLPSLCNSGIL